MNSTLLTSKEYAKELIRKYKGFSCTEHFGKESNLITAKQCADICVDQIISALFQDWKNRDYYIQVKKEIQMYYEN